MNPFTLLWYTFPYMNEKRFLNLILTSMFLLLTVMAVLLMMSQIQKEMMNFLFENEKLQNQVYQMYLNDELDNMLIPDEIESLGFYNFYGEPLYLQGSAVKVLVEDSTLRPFFNREKNTIVITKDLLNPFVPFLNNEENVQAAHEALFNYADKRSEEDKNLMVRYVYLEMTDSPIAGFILRTRIIMGVVIFLILLIVLYIGSLYRRNMKYHEQIESQERLVMLGTAARTFTHEVKNPLSSIRLQSSIIKRSTAGEHEGALDIINEEVARLASMTERIGDFLRKPEGNPCRTDITMESIRLIEKKQDVLGHLNLDDAPELIIMIDPERLSSIMDNLINNALESGSEFTDVSLSLERQGAEAEIILSDKGEGISGDDMKRIYDPFFTTKSKGSGVGLSIVNSFVQAAGGDLEISTTVGEGTTVSIRFPLVKDL